MKEIETTNYDSPIHCMMCCTKTTDNLGNIKPCPHLVYLGTSEGAEFLIYDAVEEPDDSDEWVEYDAQLDEFRKKLDDEHLCVHITTPAPSGETYCIIYNLNAKIQYGKDPPNTDAKQQGPSRSELSDDDATRKKKEIEALKKLRLYMGDEDFKESLGSTADAFLSANAKYYDTDTLEKMK
jgi:hypothetical protein